MEEIVVYVSIVLMIVSLFLTVIGAIKYMKGNKSKVLIFTGLCLFVIGIISFSLGMQQVRKIVEKKAEQSMLKAIDESDFEENIEEAMQEAKDEMDAVTEEYSELAEEGKKIKK